MGAGQETLHQRCAWGVNGKTWASGKLPARHTDTSAQFFMALSTQNSPIQKPHHSLRSDFTGFIRAAFTL